jgi:large subunit ribosomal protein L2
MARSAGTYGVLMGREGKYAIVKLPSGEVRKVLLTCKATIGTTSNPDHGQQVLGKAGRKRWLGRRPRTRGVAMNPVDHPMGGGEGRASGGHPRSRTGVMAKGEKTRNPKKTSSRLIVSKRKSKNKK